MGKSRSDDASWVTDGLFELANLTRGTLVGGRIRSAGSSATRRKGLLGISEIDPDAGLWISPCEAVHTFGMKMPIDVLFLDRHHCVRKIQRQLARNRISICFSASCVVELAAGRASASGTEVNDRLEFRPVGL